MGNAIACQPYCMKDELVTDHQRVDINAQHASGKYPAPPTPLGSEVRAWEDECEDMGRPLPPPPPPLGGLGLSEDAQDHSAGASLQPRPASVTSSHASYAAPPAPPPPPQHSAVRNAVASWQAPGGEVPAPMSSLPGWHLSQPPPPISAAIETALSNHRGGAIMGPPPVLAGSAHSGLRSLEREAGSAGAAASSFHTQGSESAGSFHTYRADENGASFHTQPALAGEEAPEQDFDDEGGAFSTGNTHVWNGPAPCHGGPPQSYPSAQSWGEASIGAPFYAEQDQVAPSQPDLQPPVPSLQSRPKASRPARWSSLADSTGMPSMARGPVGRFFDDRPEGQQAGPELSVIDAKIKAKEWQLQLKLEAKNMDREIKRIQSEEAKFRKKITSEAQKGNAQNVQEIARTIVRGRQAVSRLEKTKSSMHAINLQLTTAIATMTMKNSMRVSVDAMREMGDMNRVEDIGAVMEGMQHEMERCHMQEVGMEEAFLDEEEEAEAEMEARRVLEEMELDRLGLLASCATGTAGAAHEAAGTVGAAGAMGTMGGATVSPDRPRSRVGATPGRQYSEQGGLRGSPDVD
mmetsp:Transcript_82/g.185  ORF Transcript_82/g.185 Transcript_82/m.185 type:complete len:576 (+) Transcript_82:1-1728(+)